MIACHPDWPIAVLFQLPPGVSVPETISISLGDGRITVCDVIEVNELKAKTEVVVAVPKEAQKKVLDSMRSRTPLAVSFGSEVADDNDCSGA